VIIKEKEENAHAERKGEKRCKGFEDTGS